jgi:hypothetical protein
LIFFIFLDPNSHLAYSIVAAWGAMSKVRTYADDSRSVSAGPPPVEADRLFNHVGVHQDLAASNGSEIVNVLLELNNAECKFDSRAKHAPANAGIPIARAITRITRLEKHCPKAYEFSPKAWEESSQGL